MDIKNKKVLVVGSGLSGIGAAKLLCRIGAKPIIFDGDAAKTVQDIQCKLPEDMPIGIVTGEIPQTLLKQIALAVLSPGVSLEQELVWQMKEAGIPVIGELELAYTYEKGKLIAITGTNGKTTTTALIGKIMEVCHKQVYVVGNIGNPYTDVALATADDTISVAEVSSFQLETTQHFAPDVAVILNITPDHLDRHHTMECYVAMKGRILSNQTKDQICVLNYDNEYTRRMGEKAAAGKVIYFSTREKLANGIWLKGDDICISRYGIHKKIMGIRDMKLVGICNVENVMAAIAVALAMDIPQEKIAAVIGEFDPIEHRIEFVANKKGVDYYNDSKGTNPDAAIQAIRAMNKPTVLIGGGYKKDSSYDEWIKSFDGKVKAFVLIGDTREEIAACAEKYGVRNVILADTFDEAFTICTQQAATGDAVLLSPACASWGMFTNYQERGNRFKELVNAME